MPLTTGKKDEKRRREAPDTPSIQSLDRGLLILEAVGKSPDPVSLVQLAAMLGVDRSSAFRLAKTLKRRGFLTNNSVGRDYVLGSSMWRLSRHYDWSKMLARVAHKPLKMLATETNETAHLAVREGRQALFIDHVTSSHVIYISGQTGELVPLYCTSHGKALLIDFEERELADLFSGKPLKAYTKNTIQSIKSLAAECRTFREKGFATDESEYLEGVRCLAAPIRDRDGAVIASIGISAPSARFPREREREFAEMVVSVAGQIGKIVGALEESLPNSARASL